MDSTFTIHFIDRFYKHPTVPELWILSLDDGMQTLANWLPDDGQQFAVLKDAAQASKVKHDVVVGGKFVCYIKHWDGLTSSRKRSSEEPLRLNSLFRGYHFDFAGTPNAVAYAYDAHSEKIVKFSVKNCTGGDFGIAVPAGEMEHIKSKLRQTRDYYAVICVEGRVSRVYNRISGEYCKEDYNTQLTHFFEK